MDDLRYPIGKFQWIAPDDEAGMAKRRAHYIEVLSKLPAQMRATVRDLSPEQLDRPYRPQRLECAAAGASCTR